MLSIGKARAGSAAVLPGTVAAGAEEYYTGAKEAPGEWTGRRGAARARRRGRRRHAPPGSRSNATRVPVSADRAQGAPKVPGFDATFCAPKSVSLLFALGEPETPTRFATPTTQRSPRRCSVFEAEAARARPGRGGRNGTRRMASSLPRFGIGPRGRVIRISTRMS